MPSERELRRRAKSIRNIQQVTRAMQLVAASRMRRAQQSVLASRPYEDKLREVLSELAPYADPEVHPLLRRGESGRVLVLLITTDRGLVGSLNVNLIRTALRFAQTGREASFVTVGRKGTTAIRRLRLPMVAEFTNLGDRPSTADTDVIARVAAEEFVAGRVDEVHLAFTRFVSTLRQTAEVRRLLPLAPPAQDETPPTAVQYLFEPDPKSVLEVVLPRLIEVAVYQAVLESQASEQSARMVAMRNATDAAGDLIDEITLAANKARQTRVTKEMLEIATGAEALKG